MKDFCRSLRVALNKAATIRSVFSVASSFRICREADESETPKASAVFARLRCCAKCKKTLRLSEKRLSDKSDMLFSLQRADVSFTKKCAFQEKHLEIFSHDATHCYKETPFKFLSESQAQFQPLSSSAQISQSASCLIWDQFYGYYSNRVGLF